MKKNFKLVLALVLSVMMIVGNMAALADNSATAGTDNQLTLDGAIAISGLETGDTVDFFQVLQFSQNATTTAGWVATTAFAYDATNNTTGLQTADIQKILGLGSDGKPASDLTTNPGNYGISDTMAARLANIAKTATATYPNIAAAANGTDFVATKSGPEAGLYLALVTPANAATLYNPMFVGADYKTNGTHTQEAVMTPSYSPASIAKKSTITLDKTASTSEAGYEDNQPETVAVGDTVNFTVETNIPVYADNYTEAVFTVVDTLSTGLELDYTTIHVYEGKGSSKTELPATTTTPAATNYVIKNKGETAAISSSDKDGYAVVFDTGYILGAGSGKEITITYSAEVTTEAPYSVNLEKNTVEVHFSNSPTDNTGAGKLKDETKHYTFDIDADILGSTNGEWVTTEVVKVGLGPDGKEIYEKTTTLHQNQTKVGALAGATFKLYHAKQTGETKEIDSVDYQNNALELVQYTNDLLTATDVIKSDDTGRLNIYNSEGTLKYKGIRGLDVGTYYLVEESAPAGYIKYQKAVKIEIIAPKPEAGKFNANADLTENDYWKLTTYTDSAYLKPWTVWELKKYEIKIDGVATGSYTFKNASNTEDTTLHDDTVISTKTDIITGADAAGLIGHDDATDAAGYGKIVNTQGVELPHTGGIGTTLFYVGGSILVLAAAILLITKRRMSSND